LFQRLSPARTGIDFANILAESDSLNILNYLYYYNGGGVGIADFNNDGLEDIFFTGNESSCRLYLNQGGLKFEDVTKQAGLSTTQWCTGVSIADVNGDGWMDIYVCTAGYAKPEQRKNLLFINQGKQQALVFREAANEYGIADTSYSTQAAFFDCDHDGDLDLYVMNHANERETVNTPLLKKIHGEGSSNDHFYQNNGNQTFTDKTKALGILIEGYGLGIAISDVNGDGWEDIYISNDFIYNDVLYINEQGKGFSNQISQYFSHQSYNGMGCDFADFNNDARPDLVAMDMLPETDISQKTMAGAITWDKSQLIEKAGYEPQSMRNTLQLAMDSGQKKVDKTTSSPLSTPSTVYAEIGQLAGISATDWSWAPLFADFDNDGWKDLFITNGYLRNITDKDFIDYTNNLSMFKNRAEVDRQMMPKIRQLKGKCLPNHIFKNNQDLTFAPKTLPWGMNQASCSNGAAYADLDQDGDLDLVVNNINEAAFVYENKADELLKNNYLNLKLEGLSGNLTGIGAKISVVSDGQRQYLEQYPVRGFMSSVTGALHVGLGKISIIDTLEICWINGNREMLTGIPVNQTLTLKQADAKPNVQKSVLPTAAIMEEVSHRLGIDFVHQELVFNDFQYQPLLPHRFSENGPAIATGDLNGDGLEDFYAGGGKGQSGRICYQRQDGYFTSKDLSDGSMSEDAGALIFDANGDGHPDLYVVSGSCEWAADSPFYQDRLYLNDGTGNLDLSNNTLPKMHTPGTCVTAADFDGDGDLDLFVGGSAEPGYYPLPSRSYLLRNEHGHFSDITATDGPGLERPGIVTAAQWADVDNDGSPDLVLVGEWMPVSVFKNKQGKLIEVTKDMGLAQTCGWWTSLNIHDLNGDGDLDFVVGNLGLNTKYRATEEKPMRIYAKDFDGNGSLDAILCRQIEGKEKPIHQRNELLAQIGGLGNKYPRYALYATASVQEMLGKEALADSYCKNCQFLQTACFIQKNGRFSVNTLPVLAQTAPINAILCTDFNSDSHPDLLLVGNSFSPNVLTGNYDAFKGLLLLGNGLGRFQPMDASRSGFFVDGVGKSLALLTLPSGKHMVVAGVNNGRLLTFKVGMSSDLSGQNSANFTTPGKSSLKL
jgi:hypothetical protein